jgi:hypothetical protein
MSTRKKEKQTFAFTFIQKRKGSEEDKCVCSSSGNTREN